MSQSWDRGARERFQEIMSGVGELGGQRGEEENAGESG